MADRYSMPTIRGDDPVQTFQLQSALLRQRQGGNQWAKALMQQGSSTAPVNSWVEGLARALQGTVGGYVSGQEEREGKESERQMLADMVGQNSQKKAEEASQLAQAGVPGFQMPMPNPVAGQSYEQPTAPAGGGPEVVPQGMLQPAPQPAARPVNAEMIAALSGMAGQGNRTAAGALPGFQFQYQDTYQRERDTRQEALAAAREARMLAAQGQETFAAPMEVAGPDGRPMLVRFGSRGGQRPVDGLMPAGDPNATKTGLVPVMGYGPDGKQVALFPDGRGGFKVAETGDVSLTPKTFRVDAGTSELVIEAGTGRIIQTIPKDIAGKETQQALGKQIGADITGAPQAIQTADQTTQLVDSLLQHPALRMGTGGTSLLLNRIPGTQTYDFAQRVEQLQGRAFLQAFESLKGGGQITEVEGRKATQAIARLSTAQTETAFREALTELRDITTAAGERARAKMPQGAAQPGVAIPGSGGLSATPPPAPPPGFTVRQ